MEWWIFAGAALGPVIFGIVRLLRRDAPLVDDDYPVQNDFGVSMSRYGYVQTSRNGGDQ